MSQLDQTDSALGAPISRSSQWAAGALGRRWRLPTASGRVRVVRDLDVPMRDGIVLRTDVYLPTAEGPHPTVLMRSPYGRGGTFTVPMALPYATRGYAVVVQSVRGTFGSGGDFVPVINEERDGLDTVAWLREQEWFDGRLATLGPSYMAYTQWALALDPPPELKTMICYVSPHDLAQAGMIDGAFQLGNLAVWTELVAHQEQLGTVRGMVRLMTAERRLAPQLAKLPLEGLAGRLGGTPSPWFDEWLQHPDLTNSYWDRYRATRALETSTVPALLVSGWQDWFLEQTLQQYAALRNRGVDVALTVGPWAHLTLDNGLAAAESLAWLGTHLPLRGAQPAAPRESRVRVYVTGAGEWRNLADWPPAPSGERTWFLAPEGRLADEPPSDPRSSTTFQYDPMNPTPSVGGRTLGRLAGRHDNRALEKRDDVRTFTTGPLTAPVEVLGGLSVRLFVESDNPYSDVFVRLCDVDRRGRSINVTDRLARLDPAPGEEPTPGERKLELTLTETAHRFAAGHRIRLQVSGGAHPRFARNLGTGEPPGSGVRAGGVTHRIGHNSEAPSSLTLPTA